MTKKIKCYEQVIQNRVHDKYVTPKSANLTQIAEFLKVYNIEENTQIIIEYKDGKLSIYHQEIE